MSRNGSHFLNVVMIGAAALLFALPLLGQEEETEPIITVTNVIWWDDESPVEGAEAILARMKHGLAMTINTRELTPGDAFTVWWVIFNFPENCSNGECGLDDVFLMDGDGAYVLDGNGRKQLNRVDIDAAQISILWAAGSIIDDDGTATFEGHLPIGDTTADVQFGAGLLNPMEAEVHLIMRSHGPALPGMLREQLFTQWGGCPDPDDRAPCINMQSAQFAPP